MNTRQKRKIRELRAKRWSLRDIANEVGLSHETVRAALAAQPAPAAESKPARRRKRKPRATAGTLLDVCRSLLVELRRRARETSHPNLGPRFAGDATTLAGLVLRLEAQAAERRDGITMTRAQIREQRDRALSKLAALLDAMQRSGALVCAECGRELATTLPARQPRPDCAAPVDAGGADGMLEEARKTLAWLIDSAEESADGGNEIATQRFGRGAVSVAGFVARLEKAIAARRTDEIHFPSNVIAELRAKTRRRFRAIRTRPLLCAPCNRKLSIFWGTGKTEEELETA